MSAMIKSEVCLMLPLQHRSCGKTEPEYIFLMPVCRKWILRLRRWSDGLRMAAHRLSMRPALIAKSSWLSLNEKANTFVEGRRKDPPDDNYRTFFRASQ